MRAVLMYHSIDDSGSVISVPPAVFREHVTTLCASGVRVRPLTDLVRDREPANEVEIALTFDDGFANLADRAIPLLVEHGLPATIFAVTDHVGRDNRWGGRADARVPTLPLLDWEALGRAREQGMEIGAHTRTHPHLSHLPDDAVADEVEGSVDAIGRALGVRPASFAYPFGDVPAQAARLLGGRVDVACTTVHRLLAGGDAALAVPRLDAWYFREAGALGRLDSLAFRARVRGRHLLRVARRVLVQD